MKILYNFYSLNISYYVNKSSSTFLSLFQNDLSSRFGCFVLHALVFVFEYFLFETTSWLFCFKDKGLINAEESNQGPVVRMPVSTNPGLNFNPAFFFVLSKALSRTIFSILFRVSSHQIVGKKN